MDTVAGRQLRHRCFLAQSLQRDFRLQFSRITPSLPWQARLLLLGLDPTLASCPNFGVHLWVRSFETIEELRLALLEFKRTYNEHWMLEKYDYRSPAQVRRDLLGLDAAA